jgi:hemerythrin-like domain-containing protein
MRRNLSTTKFSVNAAFLSEIKEDHQHLRDLLVDLRKAIERPGWIAHHFQGFVNQLFDLCDQLALHFALEEAFGYYEDALESTPHLHDQAYRLKMQHSELFVMARNLADEAGQIARPSALSINELISRFRSMDLALKRHESAEQGLIMAAVTQDVGVGD